MNSQARPGIRKARETLTARRRVEKALAFEKADRVPIDYAANPAIHRRLMEALGLSDEEALLRHLGVDFRSVNARYTGPALFAQRPGKRVDPEYGFVSRWVENPFGGYEDYCDFPLQDAREEALENWPMPSPDHYDYEQAAGKAAGMNDLALCVGHPGYPDVINSLSRVMGMEDCLVNLQTRDPATLRFIDRKAGFELAVLDRLITAQKRAGSPPLLLVLGEDLGTQRAPMVSHALFCDVLKPVMARFVDLAKHHGLKVMVHSCGASSWAFEDFIGLGVHAVDTLQPETLDMAPELLAARFGGRLCFHGCISTAALARQSAGEVEAACRDALRVMMPTKGYCFAPTHLIQDNTPVGNILAMYQTAHNEGVYT